MLFTKNDLIRLVGNSEANRIIANLDMYMKPIMKGRYFTCKRRGRETTEFKYVKHFDIDEAIDILKNKNVNREYVKKRRIQKAKSLEQLKKELEEKQ